MIRRIPAPARWLAAALAVLCVLRAVEALSGTVPAGWWCGAVLVASTPLSLAVLWADREWRAAVQDWFADRAAARRTDGLSVGSVARMVEAAVAKVKREKAG